MADANLSVFNTDSSSGAQKLSPKHGLKVLGVLALMFVVAVVIGLIVGLSPVFSVAALILIPAWIFYKSWRHKQSIKAIINRLAADNNWTLDQPTPAEAYKAGPTVNLPVGDTSRLTGSLNGLPFWLCIDRQDTYLLIDAKRDLPRAIFMTSLFDSGPMRIVFGRFFQAEKLAPVKLEGDFDKYFRLYTEPAATVNALSIVAPDFMASLIDAGFVRSVMFAGHFCFIKAFADDQKNLKALMVSGQSLTKELSD